MSLAQSYQLPDLISLIRSGDFALRTNQHCSLTLPPSTALVRTVIPPGGQLEEIQPGLLAALCFPTCDAPQLRVAMDFTSFFILSQYEFVHRGQTFWPECEAAEWDKVLRSHSFLNYIVAPLQHLASQNQMGTDWNLSFSRHVQEYRVSQLQVIEGVKNDAQQYLPLRRASSGWSLMFSLVAPVHGLQLESLSQSQASLLDTLRMEATNILVVSEDIMGYNEFQARDPHPILNYNLVAIFIQTKGLSLQGAMNEARNLVKKSIQSFVESEKALLHSLQPAPDRWFSRSPIEPSTREDDVKAYIQGLRDCVAGFTHWMYESECYFGKRGDEVREFGWVFLKEKERAGTDKP